MQRIRIGLTGLAGVLVLVLFAAAMLGLRSSDTAQVAANGSQIAETARATSDVPRDPLAELGVIPGGAGTEAPSATPVTPPAVASAVASPAVTAPAVTTPAAAQPAPAVQRRPAPAP